MPSILNRNYYWNLSQYDILNKYNGKTVLYNGVFYKLNITGGSTKEEVKGPNVYGYYAGFNVAINQAAQEVTSFATLQTDGEISIRPTSSIYYLRLELVNNSTINTKISASRKTLKTDSYDMFCIPAGDLFIRYDTGDSERFLQSGSLAKKLAPQLQVDLDKSYYDIQLLPYCPLQHLITSDNHISIEDLIEDQDFSYIKSSAATTQTSIITLENGWQKPTGSLQ